MVSVSTNVSNDRANAINNRVVSAGSTLAGAGIGLAMPIVTLKDTFTFQTPAGIKSSREFMQKLMPEVDTFENTAKNVKSILKETGLDAKGVKFNAIDKSTEGLNTLNGVIDANITSKKPLMQKLKKVYRQMFEEGANAAYFTGTKDIVVNKNSLYSSAYHEIGHAMNANGNRGFLGKALQSARNITPFGVSVVAPIALAVGLFHKVDKNKPYEEKGKLEKTLDFVSNNAGKLTLASYVPLLAEEGLASINGVKIAKKYLSPEQLGKLKGNYIKAWGTYAMTAALIAGGVGLGVMIANGIKERYSSKQTA